LTRRQVGWFLPPAVALAIALLAICGLLTLGDVGLPGRLESALLDMRLRLRPAHPAETRIVVVAIDDASIDRIGRWPWPRTVLARALDTLHAAGPALVAFDLLLTEADTAPADQELARAIAAGSPVLLPFATRPGPWEPPSWLSRFEYGRVAGDMRLVPQAPGLRLPVTGLAQAAEGLGNVGLAADAAGIFRTENPVVRVGEALYPSLDLEAVRILRRVSRPNVVVRPGQEIDVGGLRLHTDTRARLILDTDPSTRFTVLSFADLLEGKVPEAALAGRLVLIGATATALGDRMATAFDPALPGVLQHAGAISGLLDGRVIRRDDTTLGIDALLVLAGCLAIGLAGMRALWPGLVTAGAMLVLLPGLDLLAFDSVGWWLSAAIPLAAMSATAVSLLVVHQRRRARDLRALQGAARRDPLTGLANRAGVQAWLDAAGNTRRLVCAGDLDGFKAVNDTLGHPAGDALLCEVAARLQQALRPDDLAARLGGDEFLLLLRAPGRGDDVTALAVARDAFARVSAPYLLEGRAAAVGMSLGIAAWPDDDASWPRAMALADAALYAAKRAGKRRIYRAGVELK